MSESLQGQSATTAGGDSAQLNMMDPLVLEACWDGTRVYAVKVMNPRPSASNLLVGKTLPEAGALVPRLFSLCGRAQWLAHRMALCAAGVTTEPMPEPWELERMLASEMAQEHLWRLMLDWPALFGHAPRRARFAELHRRLACTRDSRLAFELGGDLLDLVVVELLGGFFGTWRGPRGLREFVECARRGSSVGSALADLIELGLSTTEQDAVPLLPSLSAGAWAQRFGGVPDPAFSRAPTFGGLAHETGVLSRHADTVHPALLLSHRHRCAARLFSRVIDLSECASRLRHPLANDMPTLFDAAPVGDNAGLACVETARGLLIHALKVEGERICEYAIIAPTEWNFHPEGAFVREALDTESDSSAAVSMRLRALALALDPCVPFELRLLDADGVALAVEGDQRLV